MKQEHDPVMKKYTAWLPAGALESLTESTGLGVTEILRQALKDYEHRIASEGLRALRGSLKLDAPFDWKKLKKELRGEDRDLSRFLQPKPKP